MARFFVRASSQFLQRDGTPPVTGAPFSVGVRFRKNNNTDGAALVTIPDKDVDDDRFLLEARGSGPGRTVRWASINSGSDFAETSTAWVVDTWHHALAVEAATNDRRVYLDGGGKGTNSASSIPAGLDRISIGVDGKLTPVNFMGGDIGYVAIWNIALTDEDAVSLANGLDPRKLKPDNLVYFVPMNGQSPELDIIGKFNMTVTGATKSEEPPFPNSVVAA